MSRTLRTIVATVVLAAVSFGANELSSMAGAAAAMACCAKTDYSCAGLSAPDTCCQRMHHAAANPTPSTPATARNPVTSAAVTAVSAPILVNVGSSAVTWLEFKRLHDPPHLHTFPLLI